MPTAFPNKILKHINTNNLFDCLCEILIYTVLEHKQPIYISDEIHKKPENMIFDTNISLDHLQEYLYMQLKEEINYDYAIRKLAKKIIFCAF